MADCSSLRDSARRTPTGQLPFLVSLWALSRVGSGVGIGPAKYPTRRLRHIQNATLSPGRVRVGLFDWRICSDHWYITDMYLISHGDWPNTHGDSAGLLTDTRWRSMSIYRGGRGYFGMIFSKCHISFNIHHIVYYFISTYSATYWLTSEIDD